MISMDCTRSQQIWLKTTRWLAMVSLRHATNNAHVRCTATLLMSLSQSLLFIVHPCDLFYIFTFGYCCGQEFYENVWSPGHKTRTYVTLTKYAVSANSGILHRPCVAGQLQTNNIITFAFWLERFLPFEVPLCGEAWRYTHIYICLQTYICKYTYAIIYMYISIDVCIYKYV